DASATAIYGNRASNGVILITTKKGVLGEKLTVNFSSQTSVSERANEYDVLGAQEFAETVRANGAIASQLTTLGTANTNWQDQIFRRAATYDNNISLTGSVGKLPFRVSYGNLYQEGIVITNKLKRNSGSISLTPRLFDDHLRIDVNAKGTLVDNRFIDGAQIGNAVLFDPTQLVRSDDPRYAPYGGYFQYLQPDGAPLGQAIGNPVAALNNVNNVSDVKRLIGNVQLDYKIHGVEGLRANLNLGTDISRGDGSTSTSVADFGNFLNQGRYTRYNQKKDMGLLETYLAYGKQFGETKFDIQGGYSYQSFVNEGDLFLDYRADRSTLVVPTASLIVPGYYSKIVFRSFFSRATLNVKDRYLLTATVRRDQTSRFAKDYNSGTFPAVGLGWRLKEEAFLADKAVLTELKLRGGWGRTGQQEVGGAYDYLLRYITGNSAAQYQLGDSLVNTLRASGYNRAIQWETTTTWNAGLDYGFLDNRISGSIDAYERTSSDLLAFINVAAGANLTNQLNANIGKLRNRGLEFSLNLVPVRSESWNWDVNFNVAYNRNKITELGQQSDTFAGYPTGGIPGGTGSTIQVNTVGFPSNSFYVRQQVYGADGRPLEGVYVDRTGDGSATDSDLYRYKQPAPLAVLGFTSNLAYKKINLSFLLRGNVGNYVYNSVSSNLGNFSNAQSSSGFLTNLPISIRDTGFRNQQLFSDYFLENGSFVRCENITLGYNVGKLFGEKMNLRLTGAVQNAFLITDYSGIDPEVTSLIVGTTRFESGIDNNFYPRARTFTFGLNVGF
ncbi:MAG: SusC/RagA family TonB-linked outer membrane protein, partial [Hymenobacter sp.]|nr:SusC/RagA family TonB-linked outer membrane protein [Hymenobacter sp.]